MKLIHLAVASMAWATFGSRAQAGVVLAFDGTRAYNGGYQYWLTGTAMPGPLAELQAHGYTVQTTSLLTPAVLAGVDVFVSGVMFPGTTLDGAEASALQAFVAGGGGLLYIGDSTYFAASNMQFGQLVQGADYGGGYNGSNYPVTIVSPAHPIISGPFGTVQGITGLVFSSFWTNLTSSATEVCDNPDGSVALVAVEYGSGHAVLLNDAAYFADPPSFQPDNVVLWNNTIEWLAHGASANSFCYGDGTQVVPCPCGNSGTTGRGCENSSGSGGARLSYSGTTSPDALKLQSAGETATAPSIFLQGTLAIAPLAFGDGLRCTHGILKRLYVKPAVGGLVSAPGPGDPSISARSAALGDPLVPGATRWYQTYYRDPDPLFCPSPTGSTFNVSNGLQILW